MSIYVDREYLGRIQYRLDNFVQKNPNLYNFRCPFCLDSKKNKSKRRGFIYKLKEVESFAYCCHNCGKSISFGHFLETIDGAAYREYILEKYRSGDGAGHSPVEKPAFKELKGNAAEHFKKQPKILSITKICDLPESHYARDYILNRRIPEKFWNEIYYTDKFKDFMDRDFPDHGKKEIPNDDRIVMFYTNEGGDITNVAGRALSESKIRYITIKVSDERKIFGLHRFDPKLPAIVVEGQFDSFFLDNCVASGDANLTSVVDDFSDTEWTVVFDNEPRNRDIVRLYEKAIDAGYKVCVFPPDIQEKDINDMVRAGIDVSKLIEENSYRGATAMLKFIRWRKV
jgi:hypothetical protein